MTILMNMRATQMRTCKEMANRWNISEQTVTSLCRSGKIPGAIKQGKRWQIPDDAQRPADGRIQSGRYRKDAASSHRRKPLPVGISDYVRAQADYYYVDKTLLIKEFLDQRPQVSLFTRPRRFGKTLNMDMLRVYLEISEEDTSRYFVDKAIWRCGKEYQAHQGKYPVIFLTFKDVKLSSWENTRSKIAQLLQAEFGRHREILSSDRYAAYERDYYGRILDGTASEMDLAAALGNLSSMLAAYYGTAPVIIIDEYDTPIQQGHLCGYYDEIVTFMRNFFSSGFKDNRNLSYGFLTGILRVAKESIFSGMNNLVVNSVLDRKYSEYYGFTRDEVEAMAAYYDATDRIEELRDWYDGYRYGDTEIYNPWSVVNYFSNECIPRAYWVSTSNNDLLGEILAHADTAMYEQMSRLLQGESFTAYIDTSVIYPQIQRNPAAVYSLLLVCGYLKTCGAVVPYGSGYMCEVALPNKEIRYVYQSEILGQMSAMLPPAYAIGIQEAILRGNMNALQDQLGNLLRTSVSYYDTAAESFYHGLMLGLLAIAGNDYQLSSNEESGDGRYDLCLIPRRSGLPGILIELKAGKHCSAQELQAMAASAIHQIDERHYDTRLRAQGVSQILRYGIAFSGKDVALVME